jgi:mannose-6-phosphate isomerase-like protein (cupin superfamily)
MAESREGGFQFPDTFVHLGEQGSAVPLPVTESFWPDLIAGKLDHLGPGRLVTYYEFSEDWDSWEVHPKGDELVCLVSGAIDFILEEPEGDTVVELRGPGAFLIVPSGTWHTARVPAPSAALFVTAGEGTEHRPV